jgi:hypothetical protein
MGDLRELSTRIERVSSRAAGASHADPQLLAEIEDALAEGYMEALSGEARSRRLGNRLERLMESLEDPGTAVEIRRLTLQRRSVDRMTGNLRAQLSVIRENFIRLGGGSTAPR